jgi:tetratricopeptide (TPR) repeat protein
LSQIGSLFETNRFKDVKISEYVQAFIKENPQSFTRIRLNRLLLEEAYPKEIAKSPGGVYPDREIYTPTPPDSSVCFQDYLQDAEKRKRHDDEKPNEPRLLKPGEDVHFVSEGGQTRVQVAGQVAVMSINGLLTKVIFDHNPTNEFFVEESFPLDWMYPYLTPFGIIMKINRQPLPELTEEICARDHEFWSQFSDRLIGNWITYDTSVREIADWVEKVYLHRDYTGFKGDRKFLRDDQGQKAFSKLRSSIGGVYSWRIYNSKSPAEQQRMLKEADFAFRQAFAFCPYSPEAVFRYAQLLANMQRFDDALIIAETCLKLDPYNSQVSGLVASLSEAAKQHRSARQTQSNFPQLENEFKTNPDNFQLGFNVASEFMMRHLTNDAVRVLDQVQNNPKADMNVLLTVAEAFADINRLDKLEATREKLTRVSPDQAAVWYDFAAIKATLNKPGEAIPALRQAFVLSSKNPSADPKARNLTNEVMKDARFNTLRQSPEFQQLVAPKQG